MLVPGAKAVISLLFNYFPESDQTDSDAPRIARYAYGEDYHFIIRDRLREMLLKMQTRLGNIGGRVFVDSAPVMDKAWAKKSGLGWMGKHTNLITKGHGSYFFIAELIVDIELEPDPPVTDHCGTCTACIDACPTDAIVAPYVLDASKCISYLTIELREAIPDEFKGRMENWAFGCDICQEVCPWNRFSRPHQEPRLNPEQEWRDMSVLDWKELTEETFGKIFGKSALQRTGFDGVRRNLRFIQE